MTYQNHPNASEVKRLISLHSNPELAKEPGMVYQVWQDGEITLQKSGDLLWQRNLHCIECGYEAKMVDPELFPSHLTAPGQPWGRHGYCFTTEAGAYEIRKAILK